MGITDASRMQLCLSAAQTPADSLGNFNNMSFNKLEGGANSIPKQSLRNKVKASRLFPGVQI